MDYTHTLRRNVLGLTPFDNIQNLPANFSTSKEIIGAHVSDFYNSDSFGKHVTDAYYCSS